MPMWPPTFGVRTDSPVISTACRLLRRHSSIAILYIHVVDLDSLGERHGPEVRKSISDAVRDVLKSRVFYLGGLAGVYPGELEDGRFVLIFPEAIEDAAALREVPFLSAYVQALVDQAKGFAGYEGAIRLYMGFAAAGRDRNKPEESQVREAVGQARALAESESRSGDRSTRDEIEDILNSESVRTVYQGIYSLRDAHTLGFEALSRGPAGSRMEDPSVLFRHAGAHNLLFSLERLCRRRAIEGASDLLKGRRLFLNVDPKVMNDPEFRSGVTRSLLLEYGLTEEDVVIELTERSAISDYDECRNVLSHYRDQGYTIAIDDAGSGYSSLQAIAELQPTYVKIDRSLVAGIDSSPARQAMVKALVQLASDLHYYTIAEGVEETEELRFLAKSGVDYVQGYLLGRPSTPPEPLNEMARAKIIQVSRATALPAAKSAVSGLVAPAPVLPPESSVEYVSGIFSRDRHLKSVVLADSRAEASVLGLVTRKRLTEALASQFGYALWSRKPARDIMERQVLIVPGDTPIERVAQSVASRSEDVMDDDVLVCEDGHLSGLVSVRSIIDHLAKTQIEQALDSNPLTGLPGNLAIQRTLAARCQGDQRLALLYIDIDDFKSFNDRYGFERGDQILLFTSEIIKSSLAEAGDTDSLAGHIGGDDFVVITVPEKAEAVAQLIISRFDRGIAAYYDLEDAARMLNPSKSRGSLAQGGRPMTISIAVVQKPETAVSHIRLSEIAAKTKASLKLLPRSAYLIVTAGYDYRPDASCPASATPQV